jgi:hypothetical protein
VARQELLQSKRDYWLYAVFNYAVKPEAHVVRDPARLGWQPIMAVEHYMLRGSDLLAAEEGR